LTNLGAFSAPLPPSFKEVAAAWTTEDAESHAVVGQCAEARTHISTALGLSHDNFTLTRASRVLALCGAAGEASCLAEDLAQRFPHATLTQRIALPLTRAALAFQRGESARAIELLEGVPAGAYAACAIEARAGRLSHLGATT
jgi:hypothetical protein